MTSRLVSYALSKKEAMHAYNYGMKLYVVKTDFGKYEHTSGMYGFIAALDIQQHVEYECGLSCRTEPLKIADLEE